MLRSRLRFHRLAALGLAPAAITLVSLAIAGLRPAPPDGGSVFASAKADTQTYTAEIVAGSAYKAGAEGTVTVTFAAKGEYHINAQYPYKFKANAPSEGLTYPKPTLQRADGKFEATRGSFVVPFVAAKAGKVAVGGLLFMSVCTASNCVMEKVPLELLVDVK
jgi:hypothetical protein